MFYLGRCTVDILVIWVINEMRVILEYHECLIGYIVWNKRKAYYRIKWFVSGVHGDVEFF